MLLTYVMPMSPEYQANYILTACYLLHEINDYFLVVWTIYWIFIMLMSLLLIYLNMALVQHVGVLSSSAFVL